MFGWMKSIAIKISNFEDRFRFKFADKPFVYNNETGEGTAVESYSMFSDTLHLRWSRFGYITGYSYATRLRYQEWVVESNEANRKLDIKRAEEHAKMVEDQARRTEEQARMVGGHD